MESTRQLSVEAEDKLAAIPVLAKHLTGPKDKIVSMNHETEMYVPPIEDTKYHERTYMRRNVVRLSEMENIKGGDLIDILSKPTTYAGGHRHATNKVPIF